MKKISDIVRNLQSRLFKSVISSNLVYNTCWEDPRIDRELLQIDSNSEIIMLTSAGCNALDYLLDEPAHIHCVDINPAQNALLEFKKVFFKTGNYPLLWDFFGSGAKRGAGLIYQNQLRPHLSPENTAYWDQHISYFIPTSIYPSFYFRGTAGNVARLFYEYIHRKGLYPQILKMLNAQSLQEQSYYFEEVDAQLWTTFSKWIIKQQATMAMLGVPSAQRRLINEKYSDGILEFIRKSLHGVFTQTPLHENYFWRVYLTGSYTRDCCPNYLREENFNMLQQQVDKIESYTSNLIRFLTQNSGSYSHFLLLDHQDWMADVEPSLLAKEWNLILDNAKPGAKILFRSAGSSLDFVPNFVFEHVDFEPKTTIDVQHKDRVGTYESTYLGTVQ